MVDELPEWMRTMSIITIRWDPTLGRPVVDLDGLDAYRAASLIQQAYEKITGDFPDMWTAAEENQPRPYEEQNGEE